MSMEAGTLIDPSNHGEVLSVVFNNAQHNAATSWNLKAVRLISNPG